MLAHAVGSILINGDFSPGLWSRVARPREGIECALWRQTFAADRWQVRYAQAEGAPVRQAMSQDVSPHANAACSLEIRGADGVTQPVFVGQRIEAAEAPRYRRNLVFSAWLGIEGSLAGTAEIELLCGTPREPDVFGSGSSDDVKSELRETIHCPTGRWVHLEHPIDGRSFGSTGLSCELVLPAHLLARSAACIRLANVRLDDLGAGMGGERPAAVEAALARRFFQRYDSSRINSLDRKSVV